MAEAGLARLDVLSVLLSYYISVVKCYFKSAGKSFSQCPPRTSNCNYYNTMPNTSETVSFVNTYTRGSSSLQDSPLFLPMYVMENTRRLHCGLVARSD
jgi:hypothetical protein